MISGRPASDKPAAPIAHQHCSPKCPEGEFAGNSSSKDMRMGAEVQNEKAHASLRVCSLVLLRDWHREAKVTDEGPGVWLAPRGLSLTFLFSY